MRQFIFLFFIGQIYDSNLINFLSLTVIDMILKSKKTAAIDNFCRILINFWIIVNYLRSWWDLNKFSVGKNRYFHTRRDNWEKFNCPPVRRTLVQGRFRNIYLYISNCVFLILFASSSEYFNNKKIWILLFILLNSLKLITPLNKTLKCKLIHENFIFFLYLNWIFYLEMVNLPRLSFL